MKLSLSKNFLKLAGISFLFSTGIHAETIYSDPADLSLKLNRTDGVTLGANGPNEAANPVGKSGAGEGFDRAAVFVFQLPDLGATNDPFGTASLGLYLFQDTVTGDVNGDLYGLGRREFPEVFLEDYYGRDNVPDPTDATLIQDNYLTPGGAPVDSLVNTSVEGSDALTDYLNAQYDGGAGIGQYVFLRVNSDADTTRRWNFTSVNGADGDLSKTPQITYLPASASIDTIRVETESDGSGTVVSEQTLVAGESLTAYSIGRDAGGAFIDNVPATWTLGNTTGGVVSGDLVIAEDSLSATFTASTPGSAEIMVNGNAANFVGSETITTTEGPASQVFVETEPDGFGVPVSDQFLVLGRSVTFFAISRDAGGNFVATVPATWTLEDAAGDVTDGDLKPSGDETNATLTGNMTGSTKIRATVDGLDSVDSGVITIAELVSLWDGGGPVTNLGVAENWFADTAPLFDNTTDLVFNDPGISRLNPYFGEDRTVRSLSYNADADKNLNLGLTMNGTTGAVNLTFDTDSETEPAMINVDADASGSFRLGRVTAPEVNDYGNIVLADDLLITHNGSGTLNLDGSITEVAEPRSLTKDGNGTLQLTGVNSYTGDTTVKGGILLVKGTALSDVGSLIIDGGTVEIEGNETVGNLFIGGARKAPGVYGSSFSLAPAGNQDDSIFFGAGTITVEGVSTGILEILSITRHGDLATITWTSSPGDSFSLFYSIDLKNFDLELEDGIDADDEGGVTEFTFPVSLLGENADKAFFQVVRN